MTFFSRYSRRKQDVWRLWQQTASGLGISRAQQPSLGGAKGKSIEVGSNKSVEGKRSHARPNITHSSYYNNQSALTASVGE